MQASTHAGHQPSHLLSGAQPNAVLLAGTTQCPRNPRVPRASPFLPLWGGFGALQAAFPLAPSLKVTAEPQHGEGTLPARRSLDSSSPRPFPMCYFPKLTPMGFWTTSSQEWSISILPLLNSSAVWYWGGGVHAPPGWQCRAPAISASLMTPLLSSHMKPHHARTVTGSLNPVKTSLPMLAPPPQGYPLQASSACSMVRKNKVLKPPEPSPSSGLLAPAEVVPPGTSLPPSAGTPRAGEKFFASPVTFLVLPSYVQHFSFLQR